MEFRCAGHQQLPRLEAGPVSAGLVPTGGAAEFALRLGQGLIESKPASWEKHGPSGEVPSWNSCLRSPNSKPAYHETQHIRPKP